MAVFGANTAPIRATVDIRGEFTPKTAKIDDKRWITGETELIVGRLRGNDLYRNFGGNSDSVGVVLVAGAKYGAKSSTKAGIAARIGPGSSITVLGFPVSDWQTDNVISRFWRINNTFVMGFLRERPEIW